MHSHSFLFMFHLSAHSFTSFIMSIKSIPLFVNEYSDLIGIVELSTIFVIIFCSSSSLSLIASTFEVIPGSLFFSSLYLLAPCPLCNSRSIGSVHLFPIKSAVLYNVQFSSMFLFRNLLYLNRYLFYTYYDKTKYC